MTQQSNVPGMAHGMFFEVYMFDPLTNFTEEDLYQVLQFFDCKLNADVEPPCPRNFDGQDFKPQEDITVSEFADVLNAMEIVVSPDRLAKLPQELQEQFEDGTFCPYDDFKLSDLVSLLKDLLRFRLSTTQFNTLPRKMKRQFIVLTRDGKVWRYGDRRPG